MNVVITVGGFGVTPVKPLGSKAGAVEQEFVDRIVARAGDVEASIPQGERVGIADPGERTARDKRSVACIKGDKPRQLPRLDDGEDESVVADHSRGAEVAATSTDADPGEGIARTFECGQREAPARPILIAERNQIHERGV